MQTTSNNFWAFHQKWEQGYFNSLEKIGHPDQVAREEAHQRELRESLIADGIPPNKVEEVIAWAERKARDWEQGAKEGRNAWPMVYGYSLTLIFLLRLLRGSEQFEG
jgi:hypothetical protein